ncbi:MAG: hypothetical protein HXX20_13105 [Chloroflexi bacterium]|nr:hypothetical protein [Chloroflexota bacterium]NWJ96716.1 hypothetical protein [Chloroflexota bacterium]
MQSRCRRNKFSLEPAHPKDFSLLLWIAFTTPDVDEAARMIARAEKLEPGNSSVVQARQWFARVI